MNDIVISGSGKFSNVIVQGKTHAEAKKEFLKALDYFFTIRAKLEDEK